MEEKKISAAPLVSIIIPVYNTEQYLRACLDSAVNQTLREIEIIVVNDASTDNSQKIIDEYAKNDPRIVALRHAHNKMLGATRNTGLDACRGKYVMFLDSDDYLDVRACEIAYAAMQTYDVDLVEFNLKEFIETTNVQPADYNIKAAERLDNPFMAFIKNNFLSSSVCNKIFKTAVWSRVRFKKGMFYEDDVAIFELMQYCTSALKIPVDLYWYRRQQQSITKRPMTEQHALSMGRVLEEMHGIAASHKFYKTYTEQIKKMLSTYCFEFFRRIQGASLNEETKRMFYSIVEKKFAGLGLEYADILVAHTFAMRRQCAAADKKLKQRKKIILGLFVYALVISAVLLAVILLWA